MFFASGGILKARSWKFSTDVAAHGLGCCPPPGEEEEPGAEPAAPPVTPTKRPPPLSAQAPPAAPAPPGHGGARRARKVTSAKSPAGRKGPGPATLAAVPLPPRWNVNKAARPGPRGAAAPRAPARLRPLLPNRHHLHPPAAPSIALTTSRRLLPRPLNNEPGPGRAHAPRFARPAPLRSPAPSARSARAPGPAPRRL